jgi:hypothetical protein
VVAPPLSALNKWGKINGANNMRVSKAVERWFNVPEDKDNAKLKIKHLSPGEIADIFDKVFTQNIEYKKGKKGKLEPNFSQNTDKKLDRELTLTLAIVDWTGFFDRKDKLMACNHKNIILASREIEGFNEFVAECRDTLAKDIAIEKEDQKKNLKSSALEPAK